MTLYVMKNCSIPAILIGAFISQPVNAAISLDRTRVIFDGSQKAVSLTISNENKKSPYLAQTWLEDENGNKVQNPLMVLPPLQRVEAGESSQVKIKALPAGNMLPQDRESLYYFSLREIPPKSSKPNTLQIALQTRIKVFYRPPSIAIDKNAAPPQEKITLQRKGNGYVVSNPTPYFITLVDGRPYKGNADIQFEPIMLKPFGTGDINSPLGQKPELVYINDYGGRLSLVFDCSSLQCRNVEVAKK